MSCIIKLWFVEKSVARAVCILVVGYSRKMVPFPLSHHDYMRKPMARARVRALWWTGDLLRLRPTIDDEDGHTDYISSNGFGKWVWSDRILLP